MPILFFSEKITFPFKNRNRVKKILLTILRKERKRAGDISFTFCNDTFLLSLNKKFLSHNTLTDIITFQYPSQKLTGEIFISVPRVKENAKKFNVSIENELHRTMIHGVLHLCGYKDKNIVQKKKIRKKEDYYLKEAGM